MFGVGHVGFHKIIANGGFNSQATSSTIYLAAISKVIMATSYFRPITGLGLSMTAV